MNRIAMLSMFLILIMAVLLSFTNAQVPSSQPTRQPSRQPTSQPSRIPTGQPSRQPTRQPTTQPTRRPSRQPTSQPTRQPSGQPTRIPTRQPTGQPSAQPTMQPSTPSCFPTSQPTNQPSRQPSGQPSRNPTRQPTGQPSRTPTGQPTRQPSRQPSAHPTMTPILRPSAQPSRIPSGQPTGQPSRSPSHQPTGQPSEIPTVQPTSVPSAQPSSQPIQSPTSQPSRSPTAQPSRQPFRRPSSQPSRVPTRQPTGQPTRRPSQQPIARPSVMPSHQPSGQPSRRPSSQPSRAPTAQPVMQPSVHPSMQPSAQPSLQPQTKPTSVPSLQPSSHPSSQPSRQPSARPSKQPAGAPSSQPSRQPYSDPTSQPSRRPSSQPTRQPFSRPTAQPSRQPTSQPSRQPTRVPTRQPTTQPSRQPSGQPTRIPTRQPTGQPSRSPTGQPSRQPSRQPTSQPSRTPSCQPSAQPSRTPSTQPSSQPSCQPSSAPSKCPSAQPSSQPSAQPSGVPTDQPTRQPTRNPSQQPTRQPTSFPSTHPTTRSTGQPSSSPSRQPSSQPTRQPSVQPSAVPTTRPSAQPVSHPSKQPSCQPSAVPSVQPSSHPSRQPSAQPVMRPSMQPSVRPSSLPSKQPSSRPSNQPTARPTSQPSESPSRQPSSLPSQQPSGRPTRQPTQQPSARPSQQPSSQPSRQPTQQPSASPTRQPTTQPSKQPFNRPSSQPTRQPSRQPSSQPSRSPTAQPTRLPSTQPSAQPLRRPSGQPTRQPSKRPSSQPSRMPSGQPSVQPTRRPSAQPSRVPSRQPSAVPTSQPSARPSRVPTTQPSGQPSRQPSSQPSRQPAMKPSGRPTVQPSSQPSVQPINRPTTQPTIQPSSQPSIQPLNMPTSQPSRQPSWQPSTQPSLQPSSQPSIQPIGCPSSQPTRQPSSQPSTQPSQHPSTQPSTHPTSQPSEQPTQQPSSHPSQQPTHRPSCQPSQKPSTQPSRQPSARPSIQPTKQPTSQPSRQPSSQPSNHPSHFPVGHPSGQPSSSPTCRPFQTPSGQPTAKPTSQPFVRPSSQPSTQPSRQPTTQPSRLPSIQPSAQPSRRPSAQPSRNPSAQPTLQPFMKPTGQPSRQPSSQPTKQPYCMPTSQPSRQPFARPSGQPSRSPTRQPSRSPSSQPSKQPYNAPSAQPSLQPFCSPTSQPSRQPSSQPTLQPFNRPSGQPSRAPSAQPSLQPFNRPSSQPSAQPIVHPSAQPSSQPSRQPSMQPSRHPTMQPSRQPTAKPSRQPTNQPTGQPTRQPSSQPSRQPYSAPTSMPSKQPFSAPSTQPSAQPVNRPSSQPSRMPSQQPSVQPTNQPTSQPLVCPTSQPSGQPSRRPSTQPTRQPSSQPTGQPTRHPSSQPTRIPSRQPTKQPINVPSSQPSKIPTRQPSAQPSRMPSTQPSRQPYAWPTGQPSKIPTVQPSMQPTRMPSMQPSRQPSGQPTGQPTRAPSTQPSRQPYCRPSAQPSHMPTRQPTGQPSRAPSSQPSRQPSTQPSSQPFRTPTGQPTGQPSRRPSGQPSRVPTRQPSVQPSRMPSSQPSSMPSLQPSNTPTAQPSCCPSSEPTTQPSSQPSAEPSTQPSSQPVAAPTSQPSEYPSAFPTCQPSGFPSRQPFGVPSGQPSHRPSRQPTRQPTEQPSGQPSRQPTQQPTTQPTRQPTSQPSRQPASRPSSQPSRQPSSQPTRAPTRQPTGQPTQQPTRQPTSLPSLTPTTVPTMIPTCPPTSQPTSCPSNLPMILPTSSPTAQPTVSPTEEPTSQPSHCPTTQPQSKPSTKPTSQPTAQPTFIPLYVPSAVPSSHPSSRPSRKPSSQPSAQPSKQPAVQPSSHPSAQPAPYPTRNPYTSPTSQPTKQPVMHPSSEPTRQPAAYPSAHPSITPSSSPTQQPVAGPTSRPSVTPSSRPSRQPSSRPSSQPSVKPQNVPTSRPTLQPVGSPSAQPSNHPSRQPTSQPSTEPSTQPSAQPISVPSSRPSSQPSSQPSMKPSSQPLISPTQQPNAVPSGEPSSQPSEWPSAQPFRVPSSLPSAQPTSLPSSQPSRQPVRRPTGQPSRVPTRQPTGQPSRQPTSQPSRQPSRQPSATPTRQPSGQPSRQPYSHPSAVPTILPSFRPTRQPSAQPSAHPSRLPSCQPASDPTSQPSRQPNRHPTSKPSRQPSSQPSASPTHQPSSLPSLQPFAAPTGDPSMQPSCAPSCQPFAAPSSAPSTVPSSCPTLQPQSKPTSLPSCQPYTHPTCHPTTQPTSSPSRQPSSKPSTQPSSQPSVEPTCQPSVRPSLQPTLRPSGQPSCHPSSQPSTQPSDSPTSQPSGVPTSQPTSQPSESPSAQPSRQPTRQPSATPTRQPSSVPSSQPTAGLDSPELWTKQLQRSLVLNNANDSATLQSTYFELTDESQIPSAVFGSCVSWLSNINNELNINKLTASVQSIKVTSVLSLTDKAKAFNWDVVQCSNVSAALRVVNLLIGSSSTASQSALTRGVTTVCNAHRWIVKQCRVGLPALCVDCSDPCSPVNHCTNSSNSATIAARYVFSPCVSDNCSLSANNTIQSQIRLFSVHYKYNEVVHFTSLTSTSTRDSVSVRAGVSAASVVYCGLTMLSPTANVQDVIIQQNFAVSTENNEAVVTITGLEAGSSYHVRCLTVSQTGVRLPLWDTSQSLMNVSTVCCRGVTAQLLSPVVVMSANGDVVLNAISVTVDQLPSVNSWLGVSFAVFKVIDATTSVEMASSLVQPSLLQFHSTSPRVQCASLYAPQEGNYSVVVALTGSSADQYSVDSLSVSPLRLLVVPSLTSEVIAAPVLSAAVFSPDGSYLKITFDRVTNRGSSGTSFQCDVLFEFVCASTSTCRWVDDLTVFAFVEGTELKPCALPSSNISVVESAVIKAKCNNCSQSLNWLKLIPSLKAIQRPVAVIAPVVQLFSPSVIGECDAFTVDASTSTGAGGRLWSNYTVVVSSSGGVNNVSALQLFVSRHWSPYSPPVSIPSNLFVSNVLYSVSVTLCNFLLACGRSSVYVVKRWSAGPVVSIPGAASLSLFRKQRLQLSSLTSVAQCNSSSAAAVSLSYDWTVTVNGVRNLSMLSESKDSSKFLLSSFSLQVNTAYQVCVTVWQSTLSSASSVACVSVVVVQGELVAAVLGGTSRSVSVNQSFVVDGSLSYDEDVQGPTGVDAGLLFSWSCVVLRPAYQSNCSSAVVGFYPSEQSLSLMPLSEILADSQLRFDLVVYDSSEVRSSSVSVLVTLVATESPVVSMSLHSSSLSINANQLLQITASIVLPQDFLGLSLWSVDDSSYALRSHSLTPLNATLLLPSHELSPQSVDLYLALYPSTLLTGVSLAFSLSVFSADFATSTTASVSVTVNAPPCLGKFVVTPLEGISLSPFFLSALLWVDSDLPLFYEFGVYSAANDRLLLRSLSASTYTSSLLAAGEQVRNFSVACFVSVLDALSANSSVVQSVTVLPVSNVSLSQSLHSVELLLQSDGSVDTIRQVVVTSSQVLNAVNCSLAPDCKALNRESCLSTTGTCGSCLSGFVGTSGDSNDFCLFPFLEMESRRLLSAEKSQKCNTTSQCGLFASCVDHKCVQPAKQCPNNCSAHGECLFVNSDSGGAVASCGVGAADCSAVCVCEFHYSLSIDCSQANAEVAQRQTARASAALLLNKLLDVEDVSEQSVVSWIDLLVVVSQRPEELTAHSVSVLTTALTQVVTSASQLNLNYYTSSQLLVAVDSLTAAAAAHSDPQRRRLSDQIYPPVASVNPIHRESSTITVTSVDESVLLLSAIAESYLQLVLKSMVPTQQSVMLILPRLRASIRVIQPSADDNKLPAVSLPQSDLEQFLGSPRYSLQLPVSSLSSVSVGVFSVSARLYGTNVGFKSNPLTVALLPDESVCTEVCEVVVTLQNAAPLLSLSLPAYEYFNTTCFDGFPTLNNYSCAVGGVQTTECNGTAGVVYSQCPYHYNSSVCNIVTYGQLSQHSQCSVLNVTDSNVTCSCPLLQVTSSSRRVSESSSAASVSFVSMIQSNSLSFDELFVVSSHSEVARLSSFIVMGLLISVVCVVVCVAFFLRFKQHNVQKVKTISPDLRATPIPLDVSTEYDSLLKLQPGLRLVETALPFVVSYRSMAARVSHELFAHHKTFRIWHKLRTDNISEALVLLLPVACQLLCLLFVLCVLFRFIDHNEEYCTQFTTQSTCESDKSGFATGESECEWVKFPTAEENVFGFCSFVQPDRSIYKILFVGMFALLVVTPFVVAVDVAVDCVLKASKSKIKTSQLDDSQVDLRVSVCPSSSGKSDTLSGQVRAVVRRLTDSRATKYLEERHSHLENSIMENEDDNAEGLDGSEGVQQEVLPSSSTKMREVSATDAALSQQVNLLVQSFGLSSLTRECGVEVVVELLTLLKDINTYRESLFLSARFEFDAIWGLNDDGNFFHEPNTSLLRFCTPLEAHQKVFQDFLLAFRQTHNELKAIECLGGQDVELRLLQLFFGDLLHGVKRKVLLNKIQRDNINNNPSEFSHVLLVSCWLIVILFNVTLLVGIVLLAESCSLERQRAVLFAFLLWMLADLLLIEPLCVLVTHVLIPLLVMSPLSSHKDSVADTLQATEVKDATSVEPTEVTATSPEPNLFNSTSFMFVSSRLAKQFPQLIVSKVIAKYVSVWPSPLAESQLTNKHNNRVFKFVKLSAWSALNWLEDLWIPIQDVLSLLFCVVCVWLLLWWHVELFFVFPLLVVVPLVSCAVVIHFYLLHDRATAAALLNSWRKHLNSSGARSPTHSTKNARKRNKKQFLWSGNVQSGIKSKQRVAVSENLKPEAELEDEESQQFALPEFSGSDEDSGHFLAAQLGEFFSMKYNPRSSFEGPAAAATAADKEKSESSDEQLNGLHRFLLNDGTNLQLFGSHKVDFNVNTNNCEQKQSEGDVCLDLNSSPLARHRFVSLADTSTDAHSDDKKNPFEVLEEDFVQNDIDESEANAANKIDDHSRGSDENDDAGDDSSNQFFDLEYFHGNLSNGNLYEAFKKSNASSHLKNELMDEEERQLARETDSNDDHADECDLEFLTRLHSEKVNEETKEQTLVEVTESNDEAPSVDEHQVSQILLAGGGGWIVSTTRINNNGRSLEVAPMISDAKSGQVVDDELDEIQESEDIVDDVLFDRLLDDAAISTQNDVDEAYLYRESFIDLGDDYFSVSSCNSSSGSGSNGLNEDIQDDLEGLISKM